MNSHAKASASRAGTKVTKSNTNNYKTAGKAVEADTLEVVVKQEDNKAHHYYGIFLGVGVMKITYDKQADAAYIKLTNKAKCQVSRKVSEDVMVDYAEGGTVVGIEILDASKNMPLSVKQTQVPIESA